METVLNKAVNALIDHGIIREDDKAIYLFGLNQGIMIINNILLMIIIGLLLGSLWHLIVFTIGYLFLRPYAGGYHAETQLGCILSSILMLMIVSLLSRYVNLDMITGGIVFVLSAVVFSILGPVEDLRKPLDDVEQKVYQKKMRAVFIYELIAAAMAMFLQLELIYASVTLAILAVAIMVMLGWIKNNIISNKIRG